MLRPIALSALFSTLILISTSIATKKVHAHPVAYAGATSFMSLNMKGLSENTLVYSPTYYLGTGLKHVQTDGEKWSNLHLGYLVKRWNELDSQANIYLFGGPGLHQKDGQNAYFTRLGAQADWENRRFYLMGRYSAAHSKLSSFEQYQTRVGFAPFLAGFNELNVWMIVQFQHVPQRDQESKVTPLMRFFYKNVLWEMGSSVDGDWLVNLMVRY
jgi:hypothetical protein